MVIVMNKVMPSHMKMREFGPDLASSQFDSGTVWFNLPGSAKSLGWHRQAPLNGLEAEWQAAEARGSQCNYDSLLSVFIQPPEPYLLILHDLKMISTSLNKSIVALLIAGVCCSSFGPDFQHAYFAAAVHKLFLCHPAIALSQVPVVKTCKNTSKAFQSQVLFLVDLPCWGQLKNLSTLQLHPTAPSQPMSPQSAVESKFRVFECLSRSIQISIQWTLRKF